MPESTRQAVVVVADLSRYSDIARPVEQQFGEPQDVARLNDQVQKFVTDALRAAGLEPATVPRKPTGDGAIIVVSGAVEAHRFAEALHRAAEGHNKGCSVPAARRHFRIGGFAGGVVVRGTRGRDGWWQDVDLAGTVVSDATRLEGACRTGEVLIDAHTWGDLPRDLRNAYGPAETVQGKRTERFQAHRRKVVEPAPWDADPPPRIGKTPPGVASPARRETALDVWREKKAFLEREEALAQGAEKFALRKQIEECDRKIRDLGGENPG